MIAQKKLIKIRKDFFQKNVSSNDQLFLIGLIKMSIYSPEQFSDLNPGSSYNN